MSEQRLPAEDDRPIEEWSDRELMDQYRYLRGEMSGEDPEYLESDESPIGVIEDEIRRRGLQLDDGPATLN